MMESYILRCISELVESFLLQNHCQVLLFFTVLLSIRYILGSHTNLPPGPWGVPILGYLPFLTEDIHVFMMKLSKKFGSIYRLNFGNKLLVILTDPKVIREAFRREEFSARPSNTLYDIFDGYGLINTSGDIWRNQRRFLHERLRGMGMKLGGAGRMRMEERIRCEVISLLRCLSAGKNKMMSVDYLFANASTNVICTMLMSIRFRPNNPSFLRFMELHDEGFRLFLKCDIANYIPVLKYMPSITKTFQKLTQSRDETSEMIRDIIKQRREIFDPENIRDILDSYLLEEHNAKLEGRVLYEGKEFDRQLVQVLVDMFGAGEETVKTCLLWSLVYLLHNPEVMRKVQDELDAVVGRSRMPSLEDQDHLPYTEATICEILRRSSIVPLGTSHATSRDTVLEGYTIPKGATIIPLLYSCHMDPDLWDEPEKFEPTRFLDEEGRVTKPQQFLPFGVGRRMCLGHVLARSEVFLFFTSILQNFTLGYPEGEPLPSLKGNLGATYTPEPFKLMFIPREGSKFGEIERQSSEFRTMGL
ncbi:cytochrome P450 18a1-like [Penaeus chinensis]|uniref:cytochrome P450 18a1-like n=1 Tax=Penaeus chinensis TaxID=139456 RepID=UPI001FB70534|nr:cytochrome P450 18a1-like [Penaeus chinensis]